MPVEERVRLPASDRAIVAPQAAKIEAVSKVSTWRKVGVVARRRAAGKRGATARSARRWERSAPRRDPFAVLHQLWLEVTGTVFLVMAAFGGCRSARVREICSRGAPRPRVVIAIFHPHVRVVRAEFVLESTKEKSAVGSLNGARLARGRSSAILRSPASGRSDDNVVQR